METKIILTDDDKLYASRHNLTNSEMKDFVADMLMADEFERRAICEAEQRRAEMLLTPQCSVYDAW